MASAEANRKLDQMLFGLNGMGEAASYADIQNLGEVASHADIENLGAAASFADIENLGNAAARRQRALGMTATIQDIKNLEDSLLGEIGNRSLGDIPDPPATLAAFADPLRSAAAQFGATGGTNPDAALAVYLQALKAAYDARPTGIIDVISGRSGDVVRSWFIQTATFFAVELGKHTGASSLKLILNRSYTDPRGKTRSIAFYLGKNPDIGSNLFNQLDEQKLEEVKAQSENLRQFIEGDDGGDGGGGTTPGGGGGGSTLPGPATGGFTLSTPLIIGGVAVLGLILFMGTRRRRR